MECNDRMYYLGLGAMVTRLHYPVQAGSMGRAGLHVPVCVANISNPNPSTSVGAWPSSWWEISSQEHCSDCIASHVLCQHVHGNMLSIHILWIKDFMPKWLGALGNTLWQNKLYQIFKVFWWVAHLCVALRDLYSAWMGTHIKACLSGWNLKPYPADT